MSHFPEAVGLRSFTYGAAGHLEAVDSAGNLVDFGYDAAGRNATPFAYDGRSYVTAAGAPAGPLGATHPTYSSAGLLHTLTQRVTATDAGKTHHVFHFAGRPVAQLTIEDATETWRYLTTDHLGTPLVATDAAGAELWAGPFEPFGKDRLEGTNLASSAEDVFLRLPGQWDDEVWRESTRGPEVYYNLHRWYAQGTGMYSRSDPLGLRGGHNLYRYASSNPISFVDPLGLVVQRCCRDIQVNQFLDMTARVLGLKHCFLKTDTVEAGMGPADGGPLPACPIYDDTAVIDHKGQSTWPGTRCVVIPDVDEECVNRELQLGRPTGEWSPINQCNSFADGILNKCRKRCPASKPGFNFCHSFGCLGNR